MTTSPALFICLIANLLGLCSAFSSHHLPSARRRPSQQHHLPRRRSLLLEKTESDEASTSRYEDSDVASKGLVSSLTGFVNSFLKNEQEPRDRSGESDATPPASPQELLERIRSDYTDKNYLWTGDIDLSAFDSNCQFTDPTLSFTGTDTFVQNLQNLRPLVDAVVKEPADCKSILLDIQLKPEYVQTRWNMVGELSALPWKPKIDVIGRTKFWFRTGDSVADETSLAETNEGYTVFFYDEEWEIPAAKALLQLITPAGTIRNSSLAASEQPDL